jgi:hypothetical protein
MLQLTALSLRKRHSKQLAEDRNRHRLGEVRGKVERLDVIIEQMVGDMSPTGTAISLITEGTKAAMTNRRSRV